MGTAASQSFGNHGGTSAWRTRRSCWRARPATWAGDQLLWELRAPGGQGADLEATGGTGGKFGWVSYFHAGGIDRPLTIIKNEIVVVPHQNWRGQFARGTYPDGRISDCGPTTGTNCLAVAWPGWRTNPWHQDADAPDIVTWAGSLVDGMRDESGQMYMRNRYYDPATGQFTQPDPIGLAGGLNSYGFAAGDPVTYTDPYGLKADSIYIHGSRLYQWAVGEALKFFARNNSSFRQAYDAISKSSEAHVHFYDQSCRRGYGNCQGMSSSRTAYADVFHNPDGVAFMNSIGHEFLHAAGDLSEPASTGIERECGRPDGSANGCIAYYDNILRDMLGRDNVNDEDGKRFARENGKPMWTTGNP